MQRVAKSATLLVMLLYVACFVGYGCKKKPQETSVSMTQKETAIAISAGESHTCAITSSGGVKCWGSNNGGLLGDGTSVTLRSTPVNVATLTTGVSAISAGGSHNCALTTVGEVKCWGSNAYGQLGDGTTVSPSEPVSVTALAGDIKMISSGSLHTCALTSSGGVK